jgi:hypothetical protein
MATLTEARELVRRKMGTAEAIGDLWTFKNAVDNGSYILIGLHTRTFKTLSS